MIVYFFRLCIIPQRKVPVWGQAASLLTALLAGVKGGSCLWLSLPYLVVVYGVGGGAGPCPGLTLSLFSPAVSLCQACVHPSHVLRVSLEPHSVLSGGSAISAHQLIASPPQRGCLSMAISSRLALWEQKESGARGWGWDFRS